MKYTVASCLAVLQRENLLEKISLKTLSDSTPITGISADNRIIGKGNLFLCKGVSFKKEYLESAMLMGASFYVSDRVWIEEYPYVLVKDVRLAMAAIAKWFYGESTEGMIKVGITGTKGKTTSSTILHGVLKNYAATQGIPFPALISSLSLCNGKNEIAATLSTPEPFDLWKCLADAGDYGACHAVCEVSSQALKYHRTKGIFFDIAVFLNIGEDHISDIEHKDFEDYFSSKLKIFENAKVACINSSTERFEEVVKAAEEAGCEVVTYGYRSDDTLSCCSVVGRASGTDFSVSWMNGTPEEYSIALSGRYNVENAMASLAASYLLKLPYENKRNGLANVSVKGRGVHLFTCDGAITTIVDYAHNKISMEALIEYVKEQFVGQRVITVFGCPGGKAKNRREGMGVVAGEGSDYVIITEDDPDKEDLASICREIASYVSKTNTPYEIIMNREDAIARAFSLVNKSGGVILLCGKGAEKTQKRSGQAVPYVSDECIAMQCIAVYDKENVTVS